MKMNNIKYQLKEKNSGIDGWDSKTKLLAIFDTKELAESWPARS